MMVTQDPGFGFADPVLDSQSTFRAVLDALSRPGSRHDLGASGVTPPDGLPLAAAAILLTVADRETPVWLPGGRGHPASAWLTFHTGAAPDAVIGAAQFAVIDGAAPEPRLADFPVGDERYPDRSATVIVLCAALDGGAPVRLSGPGLKEPLTIAPQGLRPGFWDEVRANAARFPLGIDILLVADTRMIGLPRTTQIGETA